MNHAAVETFQKEYARLPLKIQKCVDNNFEVIKQYPNHPLLRLMNVEEYYSMRIDTRYRAVGIQEDDTIIWFWVGNYSQYKTDFL
ncbi:MAG: hypothetical protein H3C35_00845 [Bacteroidetes bacterium]|nr:hypothetical protein [Bacteroidota bacterium]